MIIFHFIIAIILTICFIIYSPAMIEKMFKVANKKNLIRFIFSIAFPMIVFAQAIVPSAVHYLIDMGVKVIAYFLKFDHVYINNKSLSGNFILFYFGLAIITTLIVGSMFYSRINKN